MNATLQTAPTMVWPSSQLVPLLHPSTPTLMTTELSATTPVCSSVPRRRPTGNGPGPGSVTGSQSTSAIPGRHFSQSPLSATESLSGLGTKPSGHYQQKHQQQQLRSQNASSPCSRSSMAGAVANAGDLEAPSRTGNRSVAEAIGQRLVSPSRPLPVAQGSLEQNEVDRLEVSQ
ncbi:unnamed protein product [Protopolystoma xenopodis]|uniref:Uncharacterized protein n=1 Tax=Protopolystoma xenopodis TaxID=117903 RepID=A0A3S5FEN7_9PLAT|nr:unnamed protein product [Protopolystoma xenopodis]